MKENVIRDKSYSFALQVIALYRQLCKNGEYVLSKQLLRSATSIGANVEETQAAQSKADFVAKMSIASKEARRQTIGYDYSGTARFARLMLRSCLVIRNQLLIF